MTDMQKEVIDLAREVGIDWHKHWNDDESNRLEQFAELVRADAIAEEREACARIAEEPSTTTYECTVACGGPAQTFTQRMPKYAHGITKQIRARGNA